MTTLSPRQREILRHKCETGKTNKEIGLALGIKPQTVKNNLTAAYKRLGASDGFQACFFLSAALDPVPAGEAMRSGDV